MSTRRSQRTVELRERFGRASVRSAIQWKRPSLSFRSMSRRAMRGLTERARHSVRKRRP